MKLPNLREVMLLAAIALLGAIYGVHAEDTKGPSPEVRQDGPLQERPNTLPADTMRGTGTTDTGRESDDNATRPRSREDVIRDILRDRDPTDKSSGHANPIPEPAPR